MKNKEVKLIIFEGMDGSGKSTQLNLAFEELTNKGYKVITTREPGGTSVSEKIRDLLKSDIQMSNDTVAYLFAAARCEHNLQIMKWIEEGYIVLCDRHFVSSYAYQGEKLAFKVNRHAMSIINTIGKKVLCFDVSPEESKKRISKRDEASDRFEEKLMDINYFNSVRKKYIDITDANSGIIINTDNRKEEDIHEEVMQNLLKVIEEEKDI